ncbi:MAG: Ig-like domain-containing protein, partial [Candidatus Margulisiibacteriota bacterium]
EASSPYIVSYFPSGEGVSREVNIVIRFSKAMHQTSAENAFSLTAIRNNLGNPINFPVSGTFFWVSPEVLMFSPSTQLEYNYTYQVSIASEAMDSVGNQLGERFSFTFTTISTSETLNAFVGEDGKTRLILPERATDTSYYARISTSPESHPILIDPTKISAADTKVEAENNKFKYRIANSAREFVLFSTTGERITSLKSAATITLPYSDNNLRPESLRICRLDENNNLWVIYPESVVDTTAKTVSANVQSLSTFALISLPATTLSQAYAFPNPFKPSLGHSTITFTNLASECTIKIYTLTGDLVKTLVENDGNREYSWDVKNESGENLPSGLYFYVIKSADDTKSGKLVIIR